MRYFGGAVWLTVIVAASLVPAVALRRQLVPPGDTARDRLAEVVLALAWLTIAAELLGSVGLFELVPLGIAVLAGAVAAWRLDRGRRPVGPGPAAVGPRLGMAALVATVAVVVQWLVRTRPVFLTGITGVDSRHYHLPFAAEFAQSGWVAPLRFLWLDPVWSYYPHGGELLHAIGMVAFGDDVLSPLVNIGWLAMAVLAAWCLGRQVGIPSVAVAATAAVLSGPTLALVEPGSAKNDVQLLALLLATLALLIPAAGNSGLFLVSGAAAGLAASARYTALAPVGALALVVAAMHLRTAGGSRRGVATWVGAALGAGGFWYLRNLVLTGNPAPGVLPFLPSPEFPAVKAYGRSVLHYATDWWFWSDVVPDGLRRTYGIAWIPLLGAAAAGVVLVATPRWRRGAGALPLRAAVVLAAITTASTIAYVATPGSAFGPEGDPWQFALNARYAAIAVVTGLAALGLALPTRARPWLAAGLAAVTLANLADPTYATPAVRARPSWFVAGGLLAVGAVVLARRPGLLRRLRAPIAVACAVGSIGVGAFVHHRYRELRYADEPLAAWASQLGDARIGIVAYPDRYPLYGPELSNAVVYLGEDRTGSGFGSITSCRRFRQMIEYERLDFVVAGDDTWLLEPAPARQWLASDAGARPVLDPAIVSLSSTVSVYRIPPSYRASTC